MSDDTATQQETIDAAGSPRDKDGRGDDDTFASSPGSSVSRGKRTIDDALDSALAEVKDIDADSVGVGLTSARPDRAKRRRREEEVLAPDGTVVRPGDASAPEQDAAQMAQLLRLVASSSSSSSSSAGDPEGERSSSSSTTTAASTGASRQEDAESAFDFSLAITQPTRFREMLASASSILTDRLPFIVSAGPDFAGVRISGIDKHQKCYVSARFACDSAYVSAQAVAVHGGVERRVPAADDGSSEGGVQRMVRFYVSTKLVNVCLGAMPKQMRMRVVKSSHRPEMVYGVYDGASTSEQDKASIPTLTDTDSVADAVSDAGDDWSVEMVPESDFVFVTDVDSVRSVLGMANALGVTEVAFSVKEPQAQIDGRRPDVVKHVVMSILLSGGAVYERNFYATMRWEDVPRSPAHSQRQRAPSSSSSSSAPSSARSTPLTCTMGSEAECSMSAELHGTLKARFSNRYQVKDMLEFVKTARSQISIGLSQDEPIVLEHGNAQYTVYVMQAPINPEDGAPS
jgi:hypothetical protein